MRRARLGDVFTKSIAGRTFTIHFVFEHKVYGSYCRVYKGDKVNADSLIIDNFGISLNQAQKTGGWSFAGAEDPGSVEFGPILTFESVYPTVWILIKGDIKTVLGQSVPENLRDLPVLGIKGSDVLDHLLVTGENKYSYEKWMEYKTMYGK